MNYYLPRYDLPLVLGYTGPGLSFYSPGFDLKWPDVDFRRKIITILKIKAQKK